MVGSLRNVGDDNKKENNGEGEQVNNGLLSVRPAEDQGKQRVGCDDMKVEAVAEEEKAFMLKRAAEEPLGHAAAIIADVLENAETSHVINASQKRALLQEMALRLS